MSLAKIAETAREREVDLIVDRGRPVRRADPQLATPTRMPRLLDACGALLDAAPVVSVQGTPSHDAPGCYEPIRLMGGRKWLHIDAMLLQARSVLAAARRRMGTRAQS